MDTSKILAFRHSSQAILLLESLLSSWGRLPKHARRVSERSSLPSVLQRIAIRGAKQKILWAAWAAESSIWFFTAEVTSVPSGGVRTPALKVTAYNEKGKSTASGVWVNVPRRGWRRCAL
jgi:hypothetical protein